MTASTPARRWTPLALTVIKHMGIIHRASDDATYYTRIAEIPWWTTDGYGQSKEEAVERASYMVHATNSHAALVEALTNAQHALAYAISAMEDGDPIRRKCVVTLEAARAALRAAEGGEG